MSIRVRKIGPLYKASASPPHSLSRWTNLLPLVREELVRQLTENGVHVQDAWDAVLMAEANPRNLGEID